ncbi:GNAT family N-acetyltransferase [Conexivisphaera calida]|uniref:PhnO protein n=1 Tax=Conexivisphaera calida TaxID=1874277 RepID=A0A4P2VAG5_9ARCH|nr:GNAT family N-acetyltransferase [Conexivisphaera calida]BBE41467.1 PhnO protein [Conexivisphaera calida]
MDYRIEERGDEILEAVIDLDSEISWEVMDEKHRSSMDYDEYLRRHRELFLSIYNSPGRQRFIAAYDVSGALIGVAWIKEEIDTVNYESYAYLYDLEVKREHRRSGIGRALLKRAIEYCRRNGYRRMGLRVELSNTAALRLYLSSGFRPSALLMELELDERASS